MRTTVPFSRAYPSAADYMMYLNSISTEHLASEFFIEKSVDVPRLPMISHLYPWASTTVLGGTRWCNRVRPLPDAYGGALGEASGTLFFHLCEQGRPQGACFSAGDLSLHPRDPSSPQSDYRLSVLSSAGARMYRQRSDGGDAGAHREPRAILGRTRESVAALRRRPPAADRWRGPRHPAGAAQGTRAYRVRRGVRRARRDVSAVGSATVRRA